MITLARLTYLLSVTAAYGVWAGAWHRARGEPAIDMAAGVLAMVDAGLIPPGISQIFAAALELIATGYRTGYRLATIAGGEWAGAVVLLLPVIVLAPLAHHTQRAYRRWRLDAV